jgi:hypothetical protein
MSGFRTGLAVLAVAVLASPALANDTMATLSTGGLAFVTSDDIQMTSEDLSVSMDEVKVVYEFTNTGPDQHVLVAFPMPDITGDGDFMVAIPTEADDNIFGFSTTFDGKPVEAELHQYVFAFGIDQTAVLRDLGLPLLPYGQETVAALNALPEADQKRLVALGMVIPMEYDSGQGWQTDYVPVWTLRSTYSWEADFPAGKTVEVVHRYRPSVGGTVAVTFLAEPYEGYDPAIEYRQKYCTDDSFIKAVEKTLPDPTERYGAPFTESWISYVWSTGANWSGPIGHFHLTIDKGDAANLVSFCWDGEVRKTSPTTFEMEADDWYPPWNHELEVLILVHQRVSDSAVASK